MSKLLVRLWPVINAAAIIGISAAAILFVVSVLWQFGLADLTGIFPTLSPWLAIVGSAALGVGIWVKWDKVRQAVRRTKLLEGP